MTAEIRKRGTRQTHTRVVAADDKALEQAARLIRSGALVAFPTETVYGLGANAFDEPACRQIYAVKGRAPTDPCIVHIADLAQLADLTSAAPDVVEALASAFWPGPLSLVVPKSPRVPDVITAGIPTVAVRMPAHPVAQALIARSGLPIAAPSANRFGHTSPTTAQHVVEDLGGLIPLVLDAGPTAIGVESTVLDVTHEPPRLLRPGGVTLEQLRTVLGEVAVSESAAAETESQPSPGLLSRHYAPAVPLTLFEGSPEHALRAIQRAAGELAAAGRSVGVLLADEDTVELPSPAVRVVRLGSEHDLDAIASRLFASLRELEASGVAAILTRTFGTHGRGLAIADRLRRAACTPGMDDAVRRYIEAIPPEHRPLFDRLHHLVLSAYPAAELVLSYQMPTYKVGSRRLHVGAWKHGLSLYGWRQDRQPAFLARYPALKASKGTVRLRPEDAATIRDRELLDLVRAALDA